jgi:hypothetical protein
MSSCSSGDREVSSRIERSALSLALGKGLEPIRGEASPPNISVSIGDSFVLNETPPWRSLCKRMEADTSGPNYKLKIVFRFKGGKMIRAITWLYSLVATIVFGLLGLALLISSAFGHAVSSAS